MYRHLLGGLLITLAMVLFSLVGPFVRHINVPPLVIVFHTCFFSTLLLFLLFVAQGGLKKLYLQHSRLLVVLSAFLVLGNVYCYYKAFIATTMANAVLSHYTAPVFAALLAPFILNERLKKMTVFSLAVSMGGLFLIASEDITFRSDHAGGIVYGVLSGFFYGVSILISKKILRTIKPAVLLLWQCVITVAALTPMVGTLSYTINATTLMLLFVYTIVVSLCAVFIYLTGLARVDGQHAAILAYAEPVMVVLIGILFYNETPSFKVYAGGLCIILSGFLILRAEARKELSVYR